MRNLFKTYSSIALLSMATATVLFSSCDKVTDTDANLTPDFALEINMNLDSTYNIPESPGASAYTFESTVSNSELDSTLKAGGTDLSKIESAKFTSLEFRVISPSTASFDAIESAEATIAPPDILIGQVNSIPAGSKVLALNLPDIELVTYFKQPTFQLKTKLTTKSASPASVIKVFGKIRVKYKP